MAKEKAEKGGLKRRNADGSTGRVVKKTPNKMNLVKPRRLPAESQGFGNAGTLVLPSDVSGITLELRAAMLKIASRIGEDKANLTLLDETYAVLRKHVEARAEQNKGMGTRTMRRRTLQPVGAPVAQEEASEETEEVVIKKKPNKDNSKKRTVTKKTKPKGK